MRRKLGICEQPFLTISEQRTHTYLDKQWAGGYL